MSSPSTSFSQEPVIEWLSRHLATLLTCGYAVGLAYMSLIPFDFVTTPAWDSTGQYLGYLRLDDVSMTDVLANIAAYVLLGGLAYWMLRRKAVWRIIAVFGAVFLGYLLSFAIEHAQHWIDQRVSSWVDVVANSLGALFGGLLGLLLEPFARLVVNHLRANAERNWYMLLAKLAACCILLMSLRPFDVVIDIRSAAAALPQSNFLFEAKWQQLPVICATDIEAYQRKGMYELDRMQADYLIDRWVDVFVYAGLTLLCCAGLVAGGTRGYWAATGYAGFLVQTLAALIVFIRHFLSTWGLDTAHFACAIVGWGIGAGLFGLARKIRSDSGATTSLAWLSVRPMLYATAAFTVLTVVAYEFSPFQFEAVDQIASYDKVNLVPFQPHFQNRPNQAAFDISGEMLRYGSLAFCLMGLAYHRFGLQAWRRQALICIAICTAAAGAAELCHLVIRARTTDVTTVVLAAIAAGIATCTFRALIDLRRYITTYEANDLLTSQLIEGESYDRDAIKKLAKSRGDASPKAASRSAPPD